MKFLAKDVDIPVEKIKPSPFQPRINFNLDDIRESIVKDGVLEDLWVRQIGEEYELIDGERRWRMVQELKMPMVKCDIIQADDQTARRLVWTLNTERKDYEPKEKAHYFKKCQEQGMSLRDIGKEFKTDYHMVTAYLNVLKLPDEYQEMVWNGKIPIKAIRELESLFKNEERSSKNTSPELFSMIDKVVAGELTAEQVREAVKPYLAKVREEKIEKAKEVLAEAKHEVKLETPEALEEAAEALKRKAEELKPPEEKLKAKIEKAKVTLAKFTVELENVKQKGVEAKDVETALEELKGKVETEPQKVLQSIHNLKRQLKTLIRQAEEEKHKREIEEKVKKELKEEAEKEILSKPRAVEEAWERARYNELCKMAPWLIENRDIIDEKALKPLVQQLEKGKGLSFVHMILSDLEQEAKKRKVEGRKKRLTAKDVAKTMKRYGFKMSTGERIEVDPDYDDALKFCPYALVSLVWERVPKTNRVRVLKRLGEILYTWYEHRIEEAFSLATKK